VNKNRLEAFSDGVLAIIITIMVLDEPDEPTWRGFWGSSCPAHVPQLPAQLRLRRNSPEQPPPHDPSGKQGQRLWANLRLLFWLSLIPRAHRD
jgi:hypothetical protein